MEPPKPWDQTKVGADWKGILTLNTPEEAEELGQLILRVIPRSVEIFYHPTNSPIAKEFVSDLNQMIAYYRKFLEIRNLAEQERSRGKKIIQDMEVAAAKLSEEFGQETGRVLDPVSGKRLAGNMRSLLNAMVEMSELMDVQQKKMLLFNCLTAGQAVLIMKEATRDITYQRHLNLFNAAFDALASQVLVRIDCLAAVGETNHRTRLKNALDGLEFSRGGFLEAVQQVCQNNDLTNQIALQQEVDNMTRLIAQIVAVCNDDAPKPYANFSHEIITHGLDSLADAVQTGSAAAAADAARQIAEEIAKLDGAVRVPGVLDGAEDDSKSRADLEAAMQRLKDATRNLLGAAKDALTDPTPESEARFNQALDDMRHATRVVHKPLDTIETSLPKSGLIEAATAAAHQLQELFK